MAEFLPVVVTTVYFCFMPVQEKAKRKVNELETVPPNRQCHDVFPSLASPLPPSCPGDLFEVLFDISQGTMQEEEVRQPESYGLCADFQVRLKLAPQAFRGAYLEGKGFFQSTKRAMYTKEAAHRGTLVEGTLFLWNVPASSPSRMFTSVDSLDRIKLTPSFFT